MKFLELDELKKKQGGYILCKDAKKVGLSKTGFYDYVRSRNLEKVGPGIYFDNDEWFDYMYYISLRFPYAVFSHQSALYFHDLIDREETNIVTVKQGYNTTALKKEGLRIHTVKDDLYDIGIIEMETPFRNIVRVYDMERAICETVKNRKRMDIDTFVTALKSYARRRDKDIYKLTKYAKLFKVDKILYNYLIVLL